ncbi:MAG: glycerol-3-phosphate responsive antiterminator [Clostridia bacterium]|nr:glycerol-3-phosphate responsive antiterminator [Clostridia bacterium]
MVIAAISNKDMLLKACESNCKIVFDLAPNIEQIEEYVEICHKHNKTLFVHIDLAEGIGKDKYGLRFLKRLGVDGIISTRAVMIKTAKELEMKTVQRIFVLDSHSLRTAETIVKNGADMIEVMPGVIPVAIREIHENVDIPIIAGGLVRNKEDVRMILEAGAVAASTSESDLW